MSSVYQKNKELIFLDYKIQAISCPLISQILYFLSVLIYLGYSARLLYFAVSNIYLNGIYLCLFVGLKGLSTEVAIKVSVQVTCRKVRAKDLSMKYWLL